MAAEQIVTLSASGATSVEIFCTKLDHSLDKPIVEMPVPRTKNVMDAGTSNDSYLIDIGRVKEHIQVAGVLVDDSTSNAKTKKDNLKTLVTKYRAVTITWGTTQSQTATGNIQTVMITETPGRYDGTGGSSTEERKFDVQLSFIVGTDK